MNHILGLIDTLETLIYEGKRIPFSEKIIVDEKRILLLIDKLRLVIRKGDEIVRESLEKTPSYKEPINPELPPQEESEEDKLTASQIISEAQQKASKIIKESQAYSDYILANLQLMITKMQKNIINIEKNVEATREAIDQSKNQEKEIPHA